MLLYHEVWIPRALPRYRLRFGLRILRGRGGSQGKHECSLIQWADIRRIRNWLLIESCFLRFSEESNDLILNPDIPSADVDQIFKRRHVRARLSVRASFETSDDLSCSSARAAFSQWFVQSCTRTNVAMNDQSVLCGGRSYARSKSQREVEW